MKSPRNLAVGRAHHRMNLHEWRKKPPAALRVQLKKKREPLPPGTYQIEIHYPHGLLFPGIIKKEDTQ